MTNYEIMLVVDGTLNAKDADAVSTTMQKILKGAKNLKETKMGLTKMAYKIGKCTSAYYYVLNFESENPAVINEFNRLALINKSILRHLIINVEHNYGYRATLNAKKVAKSKLKAKIYEERKKKIEEVIAAKKAQYEAEKAEQAEQIEKKEEQENE